MPYGPRRAMARRESARNASRTGGSSVRVIAGAPPRCKEPRREVKSANYATSVPHGEPVDLRRFCYRLCRLDEGPAAVVALEPHAGARREVELDRQHHAVVDAGDVAEFERSMRAGELAAMPRVAAVVGPEND